MGGTFVEGPPPRESWSHDFEQRPPPPKAGRAYARRAFGEVFQTEDRVALTLQEGAGSACGRGASGAAGVWKWGGQWDSSRRHTRPCG